MDKLDTMVEKKVLPLQQLQINFLKLTQEYDAFLPLPTLFRLGYCGGAISIRLGALDEDVCDAIINEIFSS